MMEVDLSGQCPGQLFTWWRTANEGICSFLIPTLMCMQIEGDEVAQRLLITRLETQRLRSQIEVLQEQQQALDQLRRSQEQVGGSRLCCFVPARPAALPAMCMLQPMPAMQHQLHQPVNAVARPSLLRMCVRSSGAWLHSCRLSGVRISRILMAPSPVARGSAAWQ